MTTMLATRSARRRTIAFTVLVAVTLVLMAFSANPVVRDVQSGIGFAFRPIQGALDSVAGGVASIGAAIAEIDALRVDNESLRSENDRLEVENARLEEIRRENEQLTALLQLRAGFDYETVATSVISRESSEFRRVIGLDKGTRAGIALGDVVIAAGGALAGRVTDVGPDSATVVLLTDATSTVIGQLVTSAATGTVVGQLGGVLVMDQIDSSERIDLGVEVVTAGIELGGGVRSPYPKGLLIGQVIDVRRDANSVVQTAYLQPTAELDRLEYVLVILDYEGGLPPLEEQPVDCTAEGDDGTLPEGEQPCLAETPVPSASGAPSVGPVVAAACRPATLPGDEGPRVKGIVLAGGTATRLFPLTIVTNKHLLPIYDRPMIYYPIETLAAMGIREVMVIVGGKSVGDVVELLGDGQHFGLDLTYRYQEGAKGIAHAIGLARDFVGDDAFCCILGDNILRGPALADVAREFEASPNGAGTLLYRVSDPERFGVAELDAGRERRRLRGEAGPSQVRPHPDRRLLPASGRVRRDRATGAVGPRRVRDHRRAQPLHPRRPPVHADLRGSLDRCRHGPEPAARRRTRARRR